MQRVVAAGVVFATLNLGGCTHYHQEVAALRMARPAEPAELSAYVRGDANYPSVGGDILRGAAPRAAAAYEATSGERVPPPEAPQERPTP
jgi:hypothetical protein